MKKYLKQKLKSFLWKILDLEQLQREHAELGNQYNELIQRHNEIGRENHSIRESLIATTEEQRRIRASFNIGVDFHKKKSKSFALLMIDGNPDFIRFLEFPNEKGDIQKLRQFLAQFQGSSVIIDHGSNVTKNQVVKEIDEKGKI